jgi:hypothetical protein
VLHSWDSGERGLTWLLRKPSACSLRSMQACLDRFKRMWYTGGRPSRGAIWVVGKGVSGMGGCKLTPKRLEGGGWGTLREHWTPVSRGCGSRATHGDAQRAGECGGLVLVLGRGSDVVNNHGGLRES